jgi:hypothetical protein
VATRVRFAGLILIPKQRSIVMHGEGMTNVGKKESRQINQVIDKAAKEGDRGPTGKQAEARTTPKQHRLDGRKAGK